MLVDGVIAGEEAASPRADETARVPRLVEPPRRRYATMQGLIVSAYRVAGFSILTAILIGLASYVTSQLFFLVNRTWIAPTVVSPTDERVMQLSAAYAERASQLDKLVADRATMVAQLNDARRTMNVNAEFQAAFQHALRADLDGRRQELTSVQSLMNRYRQARREIERSNDAYAGMSRERLSQERKAGLIEHDQFLNGNFQIAQIANTNLSLAERESQLSQHAVQLERETSALAAALPRDASGGLSYEVLKIKQELSRSILEEQRARENVKAFEQSVSALDSVIGRYDRLVKGIGNSPLLLATEQKMTVAFVPYDNLPSVGKDVPIYACSLGMFWCHKVGAIVSVLAAEVSNKHPLRNDMLRGQMVQLDLKEGEAATRKVLFARRAPLIF